MVECTKGTQNAEKIIALEKRADINDTDHHEFSKTIKEIRDHLLNRPSWAVTVILTILTSTCVGLIVKLASGQ